jgi:hypothetical protein
MVVLASSANVLLSFTELPALHSWATAGRRMDCAVSTARSYAEAYFAEIEV